MARILNKKFFERDTLKVAEELLGTFLVIKKNPGVRKILRFKITEVEAYDGHEDKASHAHKGRTSRTEIMFGDAGVFYIYLVYGMYFMLNIVTGKKDYPAAVLIRGVSLIAGPGKLTRDLGITKKFHALTASKKTGLWFEMEDKKINKNQIVKTSRIGVSYAGPIWSKKLYRFVLKESVKQDNVKLRKYHANETE